MIRLSLLITSLILSSVVQAATLTTAVRMSSAREIQHTLNVSCTGGEELCELLCQNQNQCQIVQPSCVDCVSQTYRLFKTIFTELNENFKAQIDDRKSMQDMVEFLRRDRWLALSFDSFYNTFTPEFADKNRAAFNTMCPGSDRVLVRQHLDRQQQSQTASVRQNTDALLLVKLDQSGRPEKISHLICPSVRGSAAYGVDYHPDLSGKANDQSRQQENSHRGSAPEIQLIYDLSRDP